MFISIYVNKEIMNLTIVELDQKLAVSLNNFPINSEILF